MLGLTPNRVAVIGSIAADAGAAAVALTGTLPHNYQTTAVLVAAVLAKTPVVLKFLEGSQNVDSLQARAAELLSTGQTVPVAEIPATLPDPEQDTGPSVAQLEAPTYNGTAPDDPWPTVDPSFAPPVAGHPDQS